MAEEKSTLIRITNTDIPAYCASSHDDWRSGREDVWKRVYVGKESIGSKELAPPAPGFYCKLVNVSVENADGFTTVSWTFRAEYGGRGGGGGGGGKVPIKELQGATSLEPITGHPRIQTLISQYARGLNPDGSVDWKTKNPSNTVAASTGLSTGGGSVSDMNPYYGVRDYFAAGATYRYTEFYPNIGSVPDSVISNVGKTGIPDGLSGAQASVWLCSGAQIQQCGISFRVTRMWMAAKGGAEWNQNIYK